jgi:tripartite-type tricarboxylate transporter receptor subunit TctC
MKLRRVLSRCHIPACILLAAAGCMAMPAFGQAQAWPTKPLRLAVGFSAGGLPM